MKDAPWVVTLVGDSSHGFFSLVIRSIIKTLHGFSPNDLPINTIIHNHDDQVWIEDSLLRTFLSLPLGGLILAPANCEQPSPNLRLIEKLIARGIPVIQIDRKMPGISTPWVGIDNFKAGYTAMKHLLKSKRSVTAVVGGRPTVSTNKLRLAGVREAVRESDQTILEEIWNCSDWESSKAAVKTFLSRADTPAAIFCLNGMATLGATIAVRDLGLRCPGDISLVGFDDNPWCLLPEAPISVIKQPAAQIGEKAAEVLWEGFHNPLSNREYVLPFELIVRTSSKTPPITPVA